MRIGINCLGFCENKRCGAEEVLLNLVHGWSELGYEKKIVFFCYPTMKEKLEAYMPNAEYVLFKSIEKHEQHELLYTMHIQTIEFHKVYKKYNLDAIAFINIGTGYLKYNVPVLVVPHDIQAVTRPTSNLQYIKYKIFYKLNFKVSNRIVAISEQDKNEILQYYPAYSREIVRIYDPINIAGEIKLVEKKEKTILAVNIQYPHKNIITLLKAFKLLKDYGTEYKLLLVGRETQATEELKEYVRINNLETDVKFLGFIDRKDLVELWKKTSLYVNPSLYEGFGMTSAESLIFGARTLLGDLPVNREVTDNQCYYFSDLQNEKELANKITDILEQEFSIEQMEKVSKNILERYNYITISKQYWEELEKLSKQNS